MGRTMIVKIGVAIWADVIASPWYSQSSLSALRLCIQEMAALNPVSPYIGSTKLGQKVKTSACPVNQHAQRCVATPLLFAI